MRSKAVFLLFLFLFVIWGSCSPIPKEDTPQPESTQDSKKDVHFKGTVSMDSTTSGVYVDVEKADLANQFETNYYYALNHLYNKGHYEQALEVFKALIKQGYSDNSLMDNCQFWIGMCCYHLGNYQQALVELDKVYMYSPDNVKAEDTQKWIKKIKEELKM